MSPDDGWPTLPDISSPDAQADVKKVRYQGQVDVEKARRQADVDIGKAVRQVKVDTLKSARQADVDIDKARRQAEVDLSKAVRQVGVDIAKAERQVAVDIDKAAQQASLDAAKALTAAGEARYLALLTQHAALRKSIYDAQIDVAKGSIARAQASAELVQKAAAAIGTLYTGVLALAFSVAKEPGQGVTSLPIEGLLPTIFLGLAIVLSTVYLAYLSRPQDIDGPASSPNRVEVQDEWLKFFIRWTAAISGQRTYWLQCSIVSLGLGVAALPSPFLATSLRLINPDWGLIAGIAGLIAVFAVPGIVKLISAVLSE